MIPGSALRAPAKLPIRPRDRLLILANQAALKVEARMTTRRAKCVVLVGDRGLELHSAFRVAAAVAQFLRKICH